MGFTGNLVQSQSLTNLMNLEISLTAINIPLSTTDGDYQNWSQRIKPIPLFNPVVPIMVRSDAPVPSWHQGISHVNADLSEEYEEEKMRGGSNIPWPQLSG